MEKTTFRGSILVGIQHVEELLLHYPSGAEIKEWAKDCELAQDPWGPQMVPEEPKSKFLGDQDPVYPDTIERGPTTPQERTRVLCGAYQFFRFGLLGFGKNKLPERLSRQIPYVLRHFPDAQEIGSWAMSDARAKRDDPNVKQWLMPEEKS
jgi:hypothetical protein